MLRDYVGTLPGFCLAGVSGDGSRLLSAAAAGRVDIVLLDLLLGEVGGVSVLQKLAALPTPPAVLVLSSHVSSHAVLLAAQLGARGFVEKTSPLSTLEAALRRIAAGGSYFSDGPRRLLGRLAGNPDDLVEAQETNRREVHLLLGLLDERPVRDSARELQLSLSSTYKLRSQLMHKAAARNHRDLRDYAARAGLGGLRLAL